MKRLLLLAVLVLTAIVCLWPIYKPLDVINSEYRWYIDLLKHTGYYFVAMLTILYLNMKINRILQIAGFFMLSVVFEYLQIFSHNRTVDYRDILFNLIGIVGATGLYFLIKRFVHCRAGK